MKNILRCNVKKGKRYNHAYMLFKLLMYGYMANRKANNFTPHKYERNSFTQNREALRCWNDKAEVITWQPPDIGGPNSFMCFLGILYLLEVSAYALGCKIFTIPTKKNQYVLRRIIN